MAALLLNSSCAVHISDFQACSPLPGNFGAVCDNFITINPQTLNEKEWNDLQNTWMNDGNAIECMTSSSISNIKKEIEKLCSLSKCDYETQQAITKGLEKIQSLGVKNEHISH